MWDHTLQSIRALMDIPYHGHMMNERYLHHFFSHQLQGLVPSPLNLNGPAHEIMLYPEWPTYKVSMGLLYYGQYKSINGRYMPVSYGKRGGYLDFALGCYRTPEIGIEFKFIFGWNAEPMIFDFLKLLDKRNPFKKVVSFTVLMRPNGVAQGGDRGSLEQAIAFAYGEAQRRLRESDDGNLLAQDRVQRFIISEIAPQVRVHRYSGALDEAFHVVDNLPP